jgi:hypothetical protein
MNSRAGIAGRRLLQQRITHAGLRRPENVVGWLGAMQAQEYEPAKWAIGLRLAGEPLEADVERAFETGRILRTHVLRPTWHFVAATDIRWLLALTGPRVQRVIANYLRRLELDSRTLSRGIDVIGRALGEREHLTRRELGEELRVASLPMSGLRLALLMMHAELEAIVCSGPRRHRQHTYALLANRAPRAVRLTRDEALATLCRRFFTSHGPATITDFRWWSGLTVADAKRGLAMNHSHAVEIDGLTYWTIDQPALDAEASRTPRTSGASRTSSTSRTSRPHVHLLPIYDEYLVAYRDRVAVPHLPTGGGPMSRNFQHALVINGQVAGTWRAAQTGDTVELRAIPCRRLSSGERDALARTARRYERFLGTTVDVRCSR